MSRNLRLKKLLDLYAGIAVRADNEIRPAIIKIAIITHKSDGYYVESESGKNLGGPYSSHEKAEDRLDEVEMFKHMKKKRKKKKSHELLDRLLTIYAQKANPGTYSATIRNLRQEDDKDKLRVFQRAFKDSFDRAYVEGRQQLEEIALNSADKAINR